jgi:hypothetical protein
MAVSWPSTMIYISRCVILLCFFLFVHVVCVLVASLHITLFSAFFILLHFFFLTIDIRDIWAREDAWKEEDVYSIFERKGYKLQPAKYLKSISLFKPISKQYGYSN